LVDLTFQLSGKGISGKWFGGWIRREDAGRMVNRPDIPLIPRQPGTAQGEQAGIARTAPQYGPAGLELQQDLRTVGGKSIATWKQRGFGKASASGRRQVAGIVAPRRA
jgi:hypothetical protein